MPVGIIKVVAQAQLRRGIAQAQIGTGEPPFA